MEDVNRLKKDVNISEDGMGFEENIGMAELLGPEVKLEEGKIIKVRVISETEDGILVDMGIKSEGLIPKEEIENIPYRSELSEGKEIQVAIVSLKSPSRHPIVSYRRVRDREEWERIAAMFKNSIPIEGTILKQIKSGLLVDIGVDAFLPISQLDTNFVKNVDKYIGKKFQFMIVEFDKQQRNIVLSRRKLLEMEQKKRRDKTMAEIEEGKILEGVVTNIRSFGAFIDIGGIEGLLHISDAAWHHVNKLEEILKIGQKVQVQILKIDRAQNKISLGMKQMSQSPWNTAVEKYPVGSIVKGKVASITDFGVFVVLEPGVEGLLHVSEISWSDQSVKLLKTFTKGQELEAKVVALDTEKEKLSLSLKRTQSNPWEEVFQRYPAGTKINGVVTNFTPFGAFVKLPEGIEGLIHLNDMSWTKKVRHPQDIMKIGDEIEVVVLEINPVEEKISLSLKHISEDPYNKYKAGEIVSGVVKRIVEFGAFIELEPGIEALVRLSEIAPRKIETAAEVLKVGQTIEGKVIKNTPGERKIDVSIRKLEQEREKELVKKYINKAENPTLGQVLESDDEE